MKVKDVMHSGLSWVESGAKLNEIAQIMQTEDIGAVPVGKNDRLIGMLTARGLACAAFWGSAT
ncbi:MAG: CBS domain-containing protein [Pseudomonadota bacterium]